MAAGRTTFLFTALALLTVVLFTADLLVGSVAVAPADIWAALTGGDCDPAIRDIILRIRLLKAVTALLAGAALAASGLQMQTLFRNPLAGPYVLGISSGAGLGVALFLLGAPLLGVSAHSFVQSLGIAGAAWLGAALVLLVVMAVSRRIKDIMVILILGMMFGSGISSVVEILQYLSSEAALKSFVIWTMGSLGDVTGGNLALMLPVIAAGIGACESLFAMLDDELAKTPWLSGEHFGLGDIAVAPFVYNLLTILDTWQPRPHLQRWYQQISQRPAWHAVVKIPVT